MLTIHLAEGGSCRYGSRTRYDGQSMAAGERSGRLLNQRRRFKSLLGSVHMLFLGFQRGNYGLDYFYARAVGCFVANRVEWDT